jgi:hypothetical protein
MNSGGGNDSERVVVVHFLRLPGGKLRCRIVDAASKISWLVPSARTLHQLIFTSAPGDQSRLTGQADPVANDED